MLRRASCADGALQRFSCTRMEAALRLREAVMELACSLLPASAHEPSPLSLSSTPASFSLVTFSTTLNTSHSRCPCCVVVRRPHLRHACARFPQPHAALLRQHPLRPTARSTAPTHHAAGLPFWASTSQLPEWIEGRESKTCCCQAWLVRRRHGTDAEQCGAVSPLSGWL